MNSLNEAQLELVAVEHLNELGFEHAYGPDIAFGGSNPERDAAAGYTDVVLLERLEETVQRINPTLPSDAIDESIRKLLRPESSSLVENSRAFQKMLTEGVNVSWMGKEGELHGKVMRTVDYIH